MKIELNNRVERADNDSRRGSIGTVVEIDEVAQRARIKWDTHALRTWMKFSSLKVLR